MIYVEARRKLVEWLRRQLVGPASEDNLRVSPLDRYPTGVLYPIQPGVSGMDPAAPGGAHDAEAALDPTAPSRVDDAGLALAGATKMRTRIRSPASMRRRAARSPGR